MNTTPVVKPWVAIGALIGGIAMAGLLLMLSACSSPHQTAPSQASADKPAAEKPAVAAASHEKSGAQLWADNCTRCHYVRSSESYSDAQWAAIMHHMRLRADLTGEEARKITEFLQSGQ